jgi:hypothetical protein
MTPIIRLLILMAFAVPSVRTDASSLNSGELTGTVTDSEGAAIGNAYLVVHPDSSDQRDTTILHSDKEGHFQTNLELGFYDVCVMSPAFTAECKKIRVKSAAPTTARFKLKIATEVLEALGDKFGR